MLAWSVVFTKPQQEARAAVELTNQADRFSPGFMVRFPLFHYERIKNHVVERVTGPLFPRYIFLKMDRDRDDWGCVRNTRGVADIICNGHRPVIIHQSIMEAIMDYKAPEAVSAAGQIFTLKQNVVITDGVLKGLEGLFTGSNKQRTKAFLDILGKKIEVPYSTIAAA